TGLKLRGAGEWLFEKHGTTKRRAWRKLHIGIDAGNGEIVAFDLTDKDAPKGKLPAGVCLIIIGTEGSRWRGVRGRTPTNGVPAGSSPRA
ncbi:MAG: transposase, partial [Rhizomicrobium sp.]